VRNVWKWIGVAGIVGVAAGGVLVARDQRRRNSYSAGEIRARLHQRLAEAGQTGGLGAPPACGGERSDPGIGPGGGERSDPGINP
jgi:hypothetical protein